MVSMLQGSKLGSTWRNPKFSFPQGPVYMVTSSHGAIFLRQFMCNFGL